MKKIGLFCAALVVALRCLGITNGVISTTTPDGRHVVVKAMDGNVFRVSNTASGETPKTTQAAALAVGEFHGGVAGDSINAVLALPSGVSATLNRRSGAVTFRDSSGRLLTDEGMRENEDGLRTVKLIPSEREGAFYGGGERGHSFDVQGDTLVMYNRQNYGYAEGDPRISQMNICVPLFVSKNGGYGVLFDDYAAAKLIMGDPIVYATESAQPVSYYFIYGEGTLSGVVKEYSALTGRQKLPPFWALGYITSKYGYKTEAETRGVIDTLKTEGYPVDGVVLDLYWYGKETDMGRLEWDKNQWQDHKGMLADLKKQGVNTVIISQPYINKIGAIDNYNELASKGLLTKDKDGNINDVTTWVGDAGMFDVANPDTRRWLRERYRALTDEGVTGWWGDLGEPEVHPETIVHANGETARQYHNVYGNVWSSIIYDLFNDEYPDTRLMTLMRGGTTGLQRYSVFPWSTDVSRSWGGLQPQVKIMLNSGLSGLGYMSHDVGGFAIDEANPVDPELYVRWLQLGTFSPVLRTHSQRFAEPYHYPEYRDIILPLVKMRYEWLPYNYTLAYENAAKGYPFVRPLNFESVGATPYDSIVDEYMWGSEVLVAPVLEKGAVSREVVFPDGVWIDYADPAVAYAGPDTVNYAAPLDRLPLFIKNGAFIPLAEYEMENTGEYDASRYTVRYYPRGDVRSSYTMYEDNRLSNSSLERGDFALIQFDGDASAKEIRVKMELTGDYPGMAAAKEISLELPGIAPTDISGVTVNGKAVAIGEKMLKIGITLNANSPVNVVIKKK